MFAIKKKKILGGVAAIFTVLLLAVPRFSQAAFWDALSPVNLVVFVFKLVAFIVNYILGLLLTLAGYFIQWMLSLNLEVLGPSNTLLYVGWSIVRDVANLGFVFVIIVIAFATILRFKEYGYKQLLVRLIMAAILVNFSLAIAGVFIDFSHVVTNFFLKRINPDGGVISLHIVDAFGPQRLVLQDDDPIPPDPAEESSVFTQIGASAFMSIGSLVFGIIFTALAVIVMLVFAFMLLARYLHLTFLLLISPIVWLFYVVPQLSGQFTRWWSEFMRWVFFAPAASFFLYLALISADQMARQPAKLEATGFFAASILQSLMIQGIQMIILSGIMLGGLIVADKMSITGARGAMKRLQGAGAGAKKALQGVVKNRARMAAQRAAQSAPGKAMADGADKTGDVLQKIGGLRFRNTTWANKNKTMKALGWAADVVTAPVRQPVQGLLRATGTATRSGAGAAQKLAAAPTITKNPKSVMGGVLKGAANGSGLLGRKVVAKEWACSSCGYVLKSAKQPTGKCPTCTGNPSPSAVVNKITWDEVSTP